VEHNKTELAIMDKIKGWVRKYAFLEGLVAGAILCHVFYHEYRLEALKDGHEAEIKLLNSQAQVDKLSLDQVKRELGRMVDYEKKYQEEVITRRTTERQLKELDVDHNALLLRHQNNLNMKWEEKYNTEKIAKASVDEEISILKTRLAQTADPEAKADPHLVKQLDLLTEQNKILQKERDELRKLYLEATKAPPQIASRNTSALLLASLSGISFANVGDTIIAGVKEIDGPVDGDTFIKMLGRATFSDRPKVVIECAPFLQKPLSEEQIKGISNQLPFAGAGEAMKVLMKEQFKK